MDISAVLAAHLAVLSAALENADGDLQTELHVLVGDVQRAVGSYTGMTMTIALDGHNVSFTALDDVTVPPVTSLQVPLAALTPSGPASNLLLYAATPGAFVDLAADLSYGLGIDPATIVLDGHLDPPVTAAGITGLDAHFAIDRAVGVLIDRGHTPETARDELRRLADLDHGDIGAAAEAVVRSAGTTPSDVA